MYPERTKISAISPVTGLIFPGFIISRQGKPLLFDTKKRPICKASKKLVGKNHQRPVLQRSHPLPVSRDKDPATTEFILEPGKEPLHQLPFLVPSHPVIFHQDLLFSPRIWVDDGNQPEFPQESPNGCGIIRAIREIVSLNLPRFPRKKRGLLSVKALSRGPKTGEGNLSLHDRNRTLVALSDLLFSTTVSFFVPTNRSWEGPPLHSCGINTSPEPRAQQPSEPTEGAQSAAGIPAAAIEARGRGE